MGEIRSTPPIVNAKRRPGRNDLCPCRSGKKFKRCCGDRGRRGPVAKVAVRQMAQSQLCRPAIAASVRQQGIDAASAYAYAVAGGELSWLAAKQQYQEMSEELRAAFWASAGEAMNDTANTASDTAAA